MYKRYNKVHKYFELVYTRVNTYCSNGQTDALKLGLKSTVTCTAHVHRGLYEVHVATRV